MFQLGRNLCPDDKLFGVLPRRAGRAGERVTSVRATVAIKPVSGLLLSLVTVGMTAIRKEEVKNLGPWRVHNTPGVGRLTDTKAGLGNGTTFSFVAEAF